MDHPAQREGVVWACRELDRLGLNAGTSGNVSVAVAGTDLVAVSPSSIPPAVMSPDDVCIVDLRTGAPAGGPRASTELALHLAIHRALRPGAVAVVHAHGVHATALGLLGREIPPITDEQVALLGGTVALSPHAPAGTTELGEAAARRLGGSSALLLRHHGMVCVGRDARAAVAAAALTERLAHVVLLTLAHGEPTELPAGTVSAERAHYLAERARWAP